ncbi:YdcF family protein [Anseongella ginsenosidimutans]|uniref:YdcF family protein n=1 Tax=Anseongella ginsenosidimutans TaxID=496056 RepID=UPI0011C8F38D|nr:YdcF family protein [Anseongella ginsenosidimutans]QEC52702.1 YdcF family protein [Anseongella ginsenosidimutans]
MRFSSAIKLLAFLFLTSLCIQSAAQDKGNPHKTIMLILGSANKKTLEERVKLGLELYDSPVSFDYIIVSGGCGAHGSAICEASEMAALLKEGGVPPAKIYKEERSKSTVQNYCYSRALKKEDGTRLINPDDTLYVVSNHWHAIPVAARFTTYDSVHAFYYIKGGSCRRRPIKWITPVFIIRGIFAPERRLKYQAYSDDRSL